MMGLGSILARRHLYDLFKLAKLYSIDAVSFLTRQEWHSVLAFADSAQLNDDVMRSRVRKSGKSARMSATMRRPGRIWSDSGRTSEG